MAMPAIRSGDILRSETEVRDRRIGRAKRVLHDESTAIREIESNLEGILGDNFGSAVELILACRGNLIVTGIGKAGLIGQKLVATFASTGTPSHFVHPSEALHGDLGRFRRSDLVLVLSNSGETEEVVRLLPILTHATSGIIAITARDESTLGRSAKIVLGIPKLPEACSHNLAPTSSTTAMLAIGDALAIVVSDERGFAAEDFAKLHPGGSLGKKLKVVDEVMRSREECRIAFASATIREVMVQVAKPGRRSGAILLVDPDGRLMGLFTDSDLARLFENRNDHCLDQSIAQLMSTRFTAIQSGARLTDALSILAQRKISELPVVDADDRPQGMVDVTDVMAWMDAQELFELASATSESHEIDDCKTISPPTLRVFS